MKKQITELESLKAAGPLNDNLKQNWRPNSYSKTYADQYGFEIHYGQTYRLIYQDKVNLRVYSLSAAKLIANIILNDIIMNKDETE